VSEADVIPEAAPDWFDWAVAQEPQVRRIPAAEAQIELLTWGEVGKPGLMLLHGNWAHAHWWRHIAPFFAADYRVAAISWSGMGGSDWRERYLNELFVREAFEGAAAAGLFEAAEAPVFIGHSFGGDLAWVCAGSDEGERLKAVITLDTVARAADDTPPPLLGPRRVYRTLEEAIASFRLAPRGARPAPRITDLIARYAFAEVEAEGQRGWALKFDPLLWSKYERGASRDHIAKARCPLAAVWAENTLRLPGSLVPGTREALPAESTTWVIPDSGHHLMVDQPIALVASLRAWLASLG
jgi:pimeloyl-ACP methyl ester carboxylesterase